MQRSGKAQILREAFIFSSLTDDELGELANLAIERRFMSNEFIFWDGDAPDWFYIIAEGKVKVSKHSSLGREFIIAFFGPGEIFGEVAVFENKPYPASAQAVSETKVIGINKEDFLFFLTNRQQVALKIINVLGGRLRDAQSRLRDLAGERVEQRLASVLLMLSSKLGTLLLPLGHLVATVMAIAATGVHDATNLPAFDKALERLDVAPVAVVLPHHIQAARLLNCCHQSAGFLD